MDILPKTPCTEGPADLLTGGIRTPLADTTPADRAGLLSTSYLISYGGAAIPAVASVIALAARTPNASNPSSGTR